MAVWSHHKGQEHRSAACLLSPAGEKGQLGVAPSEEMQDPILSSIVYFRQPHVITGRGHPTGKTPNHLVLCSNSGQNLHFLKGVNYAGPGFTTIARFAGGGQPGKFCAFPKAGLCQSALHRSQKPTTLQPTC